MFERGQQRYHHWFDGDGMVQQFSIGDGQVSHRGRLVQTSKLKAERAAGRFLFGALGTAIEGGPPGTGPDSFNTANTNAIEHAGRVLALWEGGSAHALDPQGLDTRGTVSWRADLGGLPFSAHPKLDPAGHLWNFGSIGRHLLVWHIGPDGQLAGFQQGSSPYPGGMVHDMAVTERYLVLPLPPLPLDFRQPAGPDGRRRFALQAGEPLRVLVMEKADIQRRWLFELPPQMIFHVGHAQEERDGSLLLSFIGAPDAGFLDQTAVDMLAGRALQPGPSRLQLLRLWPRSGRHELQVLGEAMEFPRMDPRRIGTGLAPQWLLCAAAGSAEQGQPSGLLHGVQLTSLRGGKPQAWDYGPEVVAEEHVLVPKPGRSGELDAWVLGTCYDARRSATVLNLLEASDLAAGPVAQAVLPYALPLGFHVNFTQA